MAYDGIPKGNAFWALVLAGSVAVAALIYGLWIVSPGQLSRNRGSEMAATPMATATPQESPLPSPSPAPAQ